MRQHLWCSVVRREVEVDFEVRGVSGLRMPVAIRRCSAFDPPAAITCSRRCLDADHRRLGPPLRPEWIPGPARTSGRDSLA